MASRPDSDAEKSITALSEKAVLLKLLSEGAYGTLIFVKDSGFDEPRVRVHGPACGDPRSAKARSGRPSIEYGDRLLSLAERALGQPRR